MKNTAELNDRDEIFNYFTKVWNGLKIQGAFTLERNIVEIDHQLDSSEEFQKIFKEQLLDQNQKITLIEMLLGIRHIENEKFRLLIPTEQFHQRFIELLIIVDNRSGNNSFELVIKNRK